MTGYLCKRAEDLLITRLSKCAFVAVIALFANLVAIENICYSSINFAYVQLVLLMDTVFADALTKWRAIENSTIQYNGYWTIVTCETSTAILCWIGRVSIVLSIKEPKRVFQL